MAAPSFPYKKVLITGATSGIGRALASKMIAQGVSVIATGRRTEHLDAFRAEHAATHRAYTSSFDLGDTAGLPAWAGGILREHPDLDGVILNAGVQRAFDFSTPASVDPAALSMEFETNYLSQVRLSLAFLPHLQARAKNGDAALLAFTTSMLAIVPLFRVANYSASKAAMHAWILALRAQLAEASGDKAPKIVEIMPPAVQTELHDTRHQPDMPNNAGRTFGMPLDQYTEGAWKGLEKGDDEVVVSDFINAYGEGGYEVGRQAATKKLNGSMPSVRPKVA